MSTAPKAMTMHPGLIATVVVVAGAPSGLGAVTAYLAAKMVTVPVNGRTPDKVVARARARRDGPAAHVRVPLVDRLPDAGRKAGRERDERIGVVEPHPAAGLQLLERDAVWRRMPAA